uniref:Putative plectin-like protein n=1 Tax=Anopheles darlingi TaxID=43151 RepID=A0A2M4D800_ANODA
MIFATIKVVKGWDFEQFLAMFFFLLSVVRCGVHDDGFTLLAVGDPADGQLRRLRREMDEESIGCSMNSRNVPELKRRANKSEPYFYRAVHFPEDAS